MNLFLSESQYTFVRWLTSLDTATEDKVAFARLATPVIVVLQCRGKHRIRETSNLFAHIANIPMRQFDLLPHEWFKAESGLAAQVSYMVEDTIDRDVQKPT
ncbi:hypothetical protein IFO70_19620 [Phormidium tenue FACHB-886]|nr:hypothetical protein [Phormidium tenue FACHB-886]